MGEKGKAYFQTWEDQINAISNADIREQAAKRYNKRMKSYNKITKALREARDELKPFMSDLNDIKKLLDSELSRGSVDSAKGGSLASPGKVLATGVRLATVRAVADLSLGKA